MGEISHIWSRASESCFPTGSKKEVVSTLCQDSSIHQGNPAQKTSTHGLSPKERQASHHTCWKLLMQDEEMERRGTTVWVYVFTKLCLSLTVGSVTGLVRQPWWHGGCRDHCCWNFASVSGHWVQGGKWWCTLLACIASPSATDALRFMEL